MTDKLRIDPDKAFSRYRAEEAILVCAYTDEDKCKKKRLDGSLTLGEFRDELDDLDRRTEVIFYCS